MKAAFRRFLLEARRRKVGSVALVYVIVAWPVIESLTTIFPYVGLAAFEAWVVWIVLGGLPVSLVLSWVYDITPEGLVKTPTLRGAFGSGETAVLSVVKAPKGSIAVMPFKAIGGAPEAESFGDGLTEELISALAHVAGVRVSARTSAFALKGAELDAREIGKKLVVSRLVEGRVRLGGDTLRLSVQLVDTTDGGMLWAHVFERETRDLFRLQEELARAIASQLHLEIEDSTVARRARHAPSDQGAHVAYAKGRHHWNRRTEADLRTAARHFGEALQLDPGFALAHTGLADTNAILLDYGIDRPVDALPKLSAAAKEAVRLAPDLGEAQTSWALACQFSWDWTEAEAAFRRAIELAPSYAVARQRFALFLAWLGRSDEAMSHIEEAERLDPLSLAVSASVGWIHYYARNFETARARLEGPLSLDPKFPSALSAMGSVLDQLGDHAGAVDHHRRAVEGSNRSSAALALLGYAYGRAGRETEAVGVLDELTATADHGYVSAYHLAVPNVGLGRTAEAIGHLQSAVTERAPNLMYVKTEPVMDPLRDHTDFPDILRAVGFPSV